MKEYLGLPTTQCTYLKTRGRCFRQTTRQDSRCYYHTQARLESRKPKRLSLKKLLGIAASARALRPFFEEPKMLGETEYEQAAMRLCRALDA